MSVFCLVTITVQMSLKSSMIQFNQAGTRQIALRGAQCEEMNGILERRHNGEHEEWRPAASDGLARLARCAAVSQSERNKHRLAVWEVGCLFFQADRSCAVCQRSRSFRGATPRLSQNGSWLAQISDVRGVEKVPGRKKRAAVMPEFTARRMIH